MPKHNWVIEVTDREIPTDQIASPTRADILEIPNVMTTVSAGPNYMPIPWFPEYIGTALFGFGHSKFAKDSRELWENPEARDVLRSITAKYPYFPALLTFDADRAELGIKLYVAVMAQGFNFEKAEPVIQNELCACERYILENSPKGTFFREEEGLSGQQEYDRLHDAWLKKVLALMITPPTDSTPAQQPAPNDECPCGSGKKFKKCCGRFG